MRTAPRLPGHRPHARCSRQEDLCPFCAEEIQQAAIVCRYCGRDLPREGTRMAAPDDPEKVYYADETITVTRSRMVIGNRTYAMANVTSVTLGSTNEIAGCGILLMVMGLFLLVFLWSPSAAWLGVVGLLAMGGGYRLLQRRTYTLRIRDASEHYGHTLRHDDRAYLQKVSDAFQQALEDRR